MQIRILWFSAELENAFFVVWRARFIALFISILKFIRDFYRAALIFSLASSKCTPRHVSVCIVQIVFSVPCFCSLPEMQLALNLSQQ